MYHLLMPEAQNFKNHVRRDLPFLSTLLVLFANVIVTIVTCISNAIHHGTHHLILHVWLIIVSVALLVIAATARQRDLKVQDRVIRLEERLRYSALPESARVAAAKLTNKQVVALRFASDGELPALIARTVAEDLEPKLIKQSIVNWRADTDRA